MKSNFFVQYLGYQFEAAELEKKIKEIWKENGGLVKDLNNIEIYLKVEENTCYYVINGEAKGSFPLV
ncbi:MAG: DUF6465 family protein [Bacillota bacterium]